MAFYYKAVVLLICLSVVTSSPTKEKCPEGEYYSDCGTTCPQTCDNYDNDEMCVSYCEPGCFCPRNYVRNKDNVCIPVTECPSYSCPEGEVKSLCENPCNDCDTKGKCDPFDCYYGCDCPPEYHRDEFDRCIPASQCPVQNDEKCPKGEYYTSCGSACPRTCDNYNNEDMCPMDCEPGCVCPRSHVRNKDNVCIPVTECPNFICPEGEVKSECENPCNDCQSRGDCDFFVCNYGCDCPPDYHRDENNKCIPASECPGQNELCPEGEYYNDCGTACPRTCDNYDNDTVCMDVCVSGCFCPINYVRNEDNVCVPVTECPSYTCPEGEVKTLCENPCNNCQTRGECSFECYYGCDCPPEYHRDENDNCIPANECPHQHCHHRQCPENEYYSDCGTACEKTCDNYDENEACTTQCKRGCFCARNYVRNKDNVCIPVTECPNYTCPEGEIKSQCESPCNDCEIRGNCNFLVCNYGCECPPEYHRNENRTCIPASECP